MHTSEIGFEFINKPTEQDLHERTLDIELRKAEDFPNASRMSNDGMTFIEPARVLEIKAQNERKRFGEGTNHRILTLANIDEMLENTDAQISIEERQFLGDLQQYLSQGRAQLHNSNVEAVKTTEIIDSIQNFFIDTMDNQVDTNSESAAVRRTALLIYKASRIPPQTAVMGGFKVGIAPLGIGNLKESYRHRMDDFIYGITTDALTWDGNINVSDKTRPLSERKQVIHIGSGGNREKNEKRVIDVLDEYKLVEQLKAKTHSSIFPEIHGIGKNSGFVEYIPGSPKTNDTAEAVRVTRKLATELNNLLDAEHIINMDIKDSNIRKRENGEPVVVDWGSAIHLENANQATVRDLLQGPITKSILPPEVVTASGEDQLIDTKKVLVYQCAATMLQTLSSTKNYNSAIESGAGYEWHLDAIGYSVSPQTVDFLTDYESNLKNNPKTVQLLKKALASNPDERPNMDEFLQMLNEL